MPKTCQSFEDQSLHLISKDKFYIDSVIQNKGAPYTDTFRIHTRLQYENSKDGKSKSIILNQRLSLPVLLTLSF